MDYGEVFVKAGRLIWKHKILWLFGLFASCAGGNPGSFNTQFESGNLANFKGPVPDQLQSFLLGLQQTLHQTPAWFFGLALALFCGAGILFWLVGVYGRTGLARGAWLADGGEEQLAFGSLSGDATRSYGKVLLASLLTGLPGLAVGLLFLLIVGFSFASLFSQRLPGLGVGLICLGVPLFCLLLPLLWLVGVWGDLATVAIVGESLGVIAGLQRGWHFLTRRLGSVLLFAVLLFMAQIVFGILVGIVFAPLGIGVILGGALSRGSLNIGLGLILLALLLLVPIALFLSAVFHSYLGTAWVLVFRRLAAAEAQPPLVPTAPISPYPPPADFPPPSTPAV